MKNLKFLFLFLLITISCNKKEIENLPSNSIYNLSSTWENQDDHTVKFKDFIGKTMVVVMIYTSCKTACPILVADMKSIKSKIPTNILKETNLVLVSIDPEVDTPAKLHEFAKTNGMQGEPWIFLRGNEDSTKEFANVLSMKFKKVSPMDFSHSNLITVFNKKGEMISQEQGAGINADKVVEDLVAIKN